MADKVSFELVSPEKLLAERDLDMVVVPGAEGDFGVLAGHAPFISTVRFGTIDMYEGGKVVDRMFVSGGFAEVTPERCTVLAVRAVPVADIDRADVEAKLRATRDRAEGAVSDHEHDSAMSKQAEYEAMLAAVDRAKAA